MFSFAGRWWWQFDLLTHFRPHYAAVLAALAAGLSTLRRRGLAAVVAVLALANAVGVVPLYLEPDVAPDPRTDQLTIITFNVQASQPGRAEVVRWLESVEVDIVFLNEASTDWEADLLRADLPYTLAFPRRPGNVFGTAVLVRGEADVRTIRFGEDQQDVVEVTTTLDGRRLHIYGSHSLSPTDHSRARARDDQLSAVQDRILSSGEPGILVGDFNTTPWSYAFPGELVNSQRGFGLQPTWRVGWEPFVIPIDHLVHTRDLATVDRRVLEDRGSDHYPLQITVTWAAP